MAALNTDRLRDARNALDLSNSALAARAHLSHGYLRNIIGGHDQPSQRVIYRLERVLGLDKGMLTDGKRTPKGDPSEPPRQPPNTPKRPPNRKDKEGEKTHPKRFEGAA